jgi:hypothetical protein
VIVMAQKNYRSRVHFLVAKEAPVVVVLQRKRAKLFHLVTIDASSNEVQEGSWFKGRIYRKRCDVSFDGRYLVYFAKGHGFITWSGVCRLPWLKTLVEADGIGWTGGGYFESATVLRTNQWSSQLRNYEGVPFQLVPYEPSHPYSRGGGLDVIFPRLERDGFRRLGNSSDPEGWSRRFSESHPELKVQYLGYLERTETFRFRLDAYPGLVEDAQWANWDSLGNLWVARPGTIEKYRPEDLPERRPSFTLDLERLERPAPAG